MSMLAWLWRRSCGVGVGAVMPAFATARLRASRATFRSIPLPLRLANRWNAPGFVDT